MKLPFVDYLSSPVANHWCCSIALFCDVDLPSCIKLSPVGVKNKKKFITVTKTKPYVIARFLLIQTNLHCRGVIVRITKDRTNVKQKYFLKDHMRLFNINGYVWYDDNLSRQIIIYYNAG
jgi:hypothetical protein